MLQPLLPLVGVASWIGASSVKATILIGVAVLVRRLLPQVAHLRYVLWLPVLLCLLCPLGPHLPLGAVGFGRSVDTRSVAVQANPASSPPHPSTVSPPTAHLVPAPKPLGSPSSRLALLLSLLWSVPVILLSAHYGRNLLRFRRIERSGREVSGTACAILEQSKTDLRLRQAVRLVETDQVDSPTLYGWFRPTLLLPRGLHHRLGDARLRHVFLHELAHVKRHDILVNWLGAGVQTLHWFNPAIWWAVRLMRSDMEQACDAVVLRCLPGAERRDYGATLVMVADTCAGEPAAYALGMADRYSALKERVIMIADFRPASSRVKLAILVLLAGFTSAALTQPSLAPARATSPSTVRAADPNAAAVGTPRSDPRDSQHADAPGAMGVPLQTLIQHVAANMHERLLVDPRTASTVILYGQKLDQVDYSDFLTILRINGFTAVELNHYINVVPIREARWLPVPTMTSGRTLPDDQFANMSLKLDNACAALLIPLLRPWMPPYAYLAADPSSNSILAIDTYANLKRVRSMIMELDARTKPGLRCGAPLSGAPLSAPPAHR